MHKFDMCKINPHTDFWGPRGPQKTLIVAPALIIGTLEPMHFKALHIFYTRSYSFWGPLDPAKSGSVGYFVNLYEG